MIPRAIELATRVLTSGRLSEGVMVKQFEEELQARLGLHNPVALNSGTTALYMGLLLAGVKPGDEVILPARTFIATGMAVLMVGATPVFADVERSTGNLNVVDTKKRITPKTRAIVPVHFAGIPADLDSLYALDLPVIEDAAQALGAFYKGQPVGSVKGGWFTAFSLQATKGLNSGDGGVLCVPDTHYKRARRMRWFGIDREREPNVLGERNFDVSEIGLKAHANDVTAAIGLGNLDGFAQSLIRRQEICDRYWEELQIGGLEPVQPQDCCMSACYCYSLLWNNMDVERAARMLNEKGVPSSIICSRIDKYTVFGGRRRDLPITTLFDDRHLAIPCHSAMSDKEVEQVIQAVREVSG